MADPTKLQIAKGLTAVIQGVDGTGGFVNNLSTSVFRGRTLFGDNDPLPMVSILEAPVQPDQLPPPEKDGPYRESTMNLILQGWVKDDRDNPTDPAYVLAADVVRALMIYKLANPRNLLGLGKQVIEIAIGNTIVQAPNETSDKPQFILPLDIRFVEDLSVGNS